MVTQVDEVLRWNVLRVNSITYICRNFSSEIKTRTVGCFGHPPDGSGIQNLYQDTFHVQ